MYTKYKSEMELLIASINDLDKKLERPMNDLDDIRYVSKQHSFYIFSSLRLMKNKNNRWFP